MSPWYQDRGGFGGEFHPSACIAVDRYGFEEVDDRESCPDVDPLATCLLCRNGITPDIDRLGPVARELSEKYSSDLPEDDSWRSTSTRSASHHLNAIRTIDSVTEHRLVEEGYLSSHTGAECVKVSDWKATHRDAADRPLFEWLLRDTIEAHLVFYRDYKGFGDDETFLEAVLNESGTSADQCAGNIAKTWRWLQDLDVPEELSTRQAGLESFGGEPA